MEPQTSSAAHDPDDVSACVEVALDASSLLRSGLVPLLASHADVVRTWARVARGAAVIEVPDTDRRFQHKAWRQSRYHRRLLQGYFAWCEALHAAVDGLDVSPRERAAARFAVSVLTGALSPSNFPWSNPVAVKRAVATRGGSFLRGARNFASDVVTNRGMPSGPAKSRFAVGKNLALTAGSVVHRSEQMELLQYRAATPTQRMVPLLVVPPPLAKFYAVDLSPGHSLVEHVTGSGLEVFCISWRNPRAGHEHWGFESYLRQIQRAVEIVREISGSPQVHLVGACLGGFFATLLLRNYAATGTSPVRTITLLASILDTDAPSTASVVCPRRLLPLAAKRARQRGIIDGREFGRVLSWLKPNELVFSRMAHQWVLGRPPPDTEVLHWNYDTPRVTGACQADILAGFYENPLARSTPSTAFGMRIAERDADVPAFVLAAERDHIAPWRACYASTAMLTRATEFVLSSSGHIQSIVSPPGTRSSFRFAPPSAASADAWYQDAEQRTGSWWPHWVAWLGRHDSERRPTPAHAGSREHPPLGSAPGSYVLE